MIEEAIRQADAGDVVEKEETMVGLRPSFLAHVRLGERGAPVLVPSSCLSSYPCLYPSLSLLLEHLLDAA